MSQPENRNAVARVDSTALAQGTTFTPNQVDLIASQIAPGASVDELKLFIHVASSRGLDPFRKHIYAIKRWNSQERRETIAFQVSIDGFRLIAERTGKYAGQLGPLWCGPDGQWVDVWLAKEPPAAAKVGVIRTDFREPTWSVARYDTFVQTTKEGKPTKFWADMPEHMLAKVAESQALRKAFPEDAGGLYSTEEMGQADNYVTGTVIDVTTGEITQSDPQPDPQAAMRRLHAVAAKQGISHDDLHQWAQEAAGVESLKDVKPEWLGGLATKLEDPETARNFQLKYGFPSDAAEIIDAEPAEPEPMFDEDDLAALNADADRALAAAKARA